MNTAPPVGSTLVGEGGAMSLRELDAAVAALRQAVTEGGAGATVSLSFSWRVTRLADG